MKVQVEFPPKLIPLLIDEHLRYLVSKGGRGSGKTRSFAKATAIRGYKLGVSGRSGAILCGREFMNSLADSSFEEIKQAILEEPFLKSYYEIGQNFIRSVDGNITYLFVGLRYNLDSLKSKARILLTWIDEAENVSEMAWRKLLPTVRETGSQIWVTYNPENRDSPTNLRFGQPEIYGENGEIIGRCVIMNWRDNPYFPDVLNVERLADKARLDDATYRWIWEGDYLELSDAQIFRNFETAEFEPQTNWHGAYFGLDFGFAQDPTASVECYVHDDCLWIYRDFAQIGLELDDTAQALRFRLPEIEKYVIRADNARPESISYLKRHGLPRIIAVEKGKGSVEDGIEFIKSFRKIMIHPRCEHTLREFKLYSYKKDRLSGDILPIVEDANNHCIDALRYALEPLMKQRRKQTHTHFSM